MAIWNNFPYSNTHELNLDYIVKTQKEHEDRFDEVIEETTGLKDQTEQLRNQAEGFKNESEDFKNEAEGFKDDAESARDEAIQTAQTLQSKVAQIDQNSADIILNTSRIDEITNLPQGSTSGDAELTDIRVSYDGTVYDTAGNSVRKQVKDLHDLISRAMYEYVNYLDFLTYKNGYYEHVNGDLTPSENGYAYYPVPITAQKTYYFKYVYGYFCYAKYFDNTGEAITDNTNGRWSGEWTAAKNGMLYVTVSTALPSQYKPLFTDSEKLYQGDSVDTYFEPNNLIIEGKKFYCGSTREYTTLRAAVEAAEKYQGSFVFVDAEQFDLLQEFSAEISSAPSNYYGIPLRNNIHIIFASGAKVLCNYDGSNPNVELYFNPFYAAGDGTYTIENLNIEASNVRYCIHDEMGHTQAKNRTVKIINCQFDWDTSGSPTGNYPQCIGGGNGRHDYIEIRGCFFKTSAAVQNIRPAVSYHNNGEANYQSEARIYITDCYFDDKSTVKVSYYGPSTNISKCFVNNCSLGAQPIIQQEVSSNPAPENYQLITYLNEIRN